VTQFTKKLLLVKTSTKFNFYTRLWMVLFLQLRGKN
jgi:hypothetical protein